MLMTDRIWQFPALADAIWAFASDALQSLKQFYGTPHFGRPKFLDRSWCRDNRDTDAIRELPIQPVWLVEYRETIWKGSDAFYSMQSFARVIEIIRTDPDLYRRLYATHGAIDAYVYQRDEQRILLFLQDCVLYPLIEKARAFEFDDDLLVETYENIEQALINPRIIQRYYISLRDVRLSRPFDIDRYTSVRLLDEDELSQSISFGTIRARVGPQRGAAFLPLSEQSAICFKKIIEVNDSMIAEQNFIQIIDAAMKPKLFIEPAQRFVFAINLFSRSSAAELGGSWSKVTSNLHSISRREQGDFTAPPTFRYDDFLVSDEDFPGLYDLFRGISKNAVWSRLAVSLARFSSATIRSSPEEAILDLVIAAESLFGTLQPGEIMYKISLNAALFLADEGLTPSSTRSFFKTIYGKRSAIVHGVNRRASNAKTSGNRELQEELYNIMRLALKKAVLGLSIDQNFLDWDKRLNIALDAMRYEAESDS